jgi:plastin-1
MAPNKGMVMQSQAPVRVLPAGGPANLKRPGSVVLHTDKTESGGHHSFSEGEVTAFREHINEVLANDPRIKYLIPLKTSDEFFSAASEGLLFCQYVNAIKPGAIPEKLICFKPNPNTFEKTQNHNLAIEALRSIGFPLVNIGPTDLMSGTKHLILGMTWQAIKAGLFSKLNVKDHPEMIALMNQNEDLNKFLTLTPEDSLFRWFNWHLRNAGVPRNVNNFTTDIKDGEAYLGLMSQLAPHIVSRAMLVERDPRRRAEMIINAATQLGCNKFVTRPEDILEPNPKLNLAFAANLFNKYPGIDVSKYDEMQKVSKQRSA